MLKKKSTSREKKRKHVQSEDHLDRRRKCTESGLEDVKDELADPELDKIGSDIEEGGLDLSVPFQPISAYVTDRQEMLAQCLNVLGEKKLQKMLPEVLKSYSLDEIKKLCWEQLEQLSQTNLLQILGGEELTSRDVDDDVAPAAETQQDNSVDSTSSLKGRANKEEPKQEGGGSGSGEESEGDVLSINADTYDSDIEGHVTKPAAEAEDVAGKPAAAFLDPAGKTSPPRTKPTGTKKEIQNDIDKSVWEILELTAVPSKETEELKAPPPLVPTAEAPGAVLGSPVHSATGLGPSAVVSQPSVQQLELLELEMRARAIKALMKANDGKKPA
ncbi:caspase activity and apoptosis inhibitor 1 [Aplochiton taeniatus]